MGSKQIEIRSVRERRRRPAWARMIASNSPSSSFLILVATLPLIGSVVTSGLRCFIWAVRLRLEVPILAALGSWSTEVIG